MLDPWTQANLLIIIRKKRGHLLISYNTELLQEICFHTPTAIEYLGEEAAASLQARHSDIQAASSVYELLVGRVSIDGNLCVLESPNFLLIQMVPNYPALVDGSQYDWSTVARVKLMGINDVR
tara:strand:+ start:138 stop:506 length:369 start_codon:yes stop_codon:yes gene_type:complete